MVRLGGRRLMDAASNVGFGVWANRCPLNITRAAATVKRFTAGNYPAKAGHYEYGP